MKTAVMLVDLLDEDRYCLELFYFRDKGDANIFGDLINLLDYTQSNGLPMVIISPRSHGFDEYLAEVRNHETFKRAKRIYKDNANAFTNHEVEEYLKDLCVQKLVLGGYNLFGCVSATAGGAYKNYSLYTAKKILFVSPVTEVDKTEIVETEGYFRKVFDNVDELARGLGLY